MTDTKNVPIGDISPFLSNTLDTYEITITPTDKYQYFHKGDSRVRLFAQDIDELLKSSLTDQDYTCYLDISFPHININSQRDLLPRLHLHGVLRFTCPMQVCKFWTAQIYKLSRFSNITINPIRPNKKDWLQYCKKSLPLLSSTHHKRYLIYKSKSPIKKAKSGNQFTLS